MIEKNASGERCDLLFACINSVSVGTPAKARYRRELITGSDRIKKGMTSMSKLFVPGFGFLSIGQHKDVVERLRAGPSRREVLIGLMAAGLTAASAGSILTAASSARAQTPVRGGTLRVAGALSSNADTADPALFSNSTDYSRGFMFYNGLTVIDPALAAQPQLATSWDQDGTNTVWTFKIREGVTFHDGAALTSADVVYSLNRHLDPTTGSKATVIASQFSAIKATGQHEVEITLVGPNADLPVLLSTPHFMIVKDATTDFSKPNGTGAFRAEEFTPGVRSLAVRNENYWKEGQPYLDAIEFFGIPEENARLNALISGDVQLTTTINPRALRQIEANPQIVLFETKGGTYTNLIMRQDAAPTNNPDFVLGMKYLMNRELIGNAVFRNYGVIANDHPIDPTNPFHAADIPQRQFDPEKAKFHLERAGVLGTPIPIVVAETARASIEMGSMLQEDGRGIGLKVDLQRVPSDGYWSNYWMKVPLGFGTLSARPTADLILSLLYKSDAAWNEAGWNQPQFDEMLVAARRETDLARRKQLYTDMQVMIHEKGGTAIPTFFSNLDAHHTSLKGMVPISTGNMMGFNFAENVWLEA
jgi:peptide/nickel transport system substrate-binding protein